MKRVLGLDLGTTSIGWALVNQAESSEEKSSIIRAGVRVNPLTTDERDCFEKGKAVTTNADRRLKRGMRRNLQRYKLRRENLLQILKREGWIDDNSLLNEKGNNSTFETYKLRAKAATAPVTLEQFSRILLMLNKKRGYKSNRKVKGDESGSLISGMDVARELYDNGITPGQYCLNILYNGGKHLPDFYRSDLREELRKIWDFQRQFYPDVLTENSRNSIEGRSRAGAAKYFRETFSLLSSDNKGKDRKLQSYIWRSDALSKRLEKDVLVYVVCDLCGAIESSSGLLGAISDRSKELFFNHQTVGQYLWNIIETEPGASLKNRTFYRQDYLDEFNTLWEKQAEFHPELTGDLKKEIRDVVIFYQRRLKSQKGMICHCEFEMNHRVAPKSSPMFQEFKVWQILNNVVVTDKETGEERLLALDEMQILAKELRYKDKMASASALRILFRNKANSYSMNYKTLEGNATIAALAAKLMEIVNNLSDSENDCTKLLSEDIDHIILQAFKAEGFRTDILDFDTSLDKRAFENQTSFKLWHLIYSYEGDNSKTGDESLIRKISEICGMPEWCGKILSTTTFPSNYGSLSNKAISRIMPYLLEGNKYDKSCYYAGYNHSHSRTKDENEIRPLAERLENLPKNSLRNPVVEKILNQMINVVNSIADGYGKPDEIHLEMARELKSNQKRRAEQYERQLEAQRDNERVEAILKNEFGFQYVRKSDIVRYKLYEELTSRGFKTLYSNQYIPRENLFSKEIDIEHIIPQSVLFDDSFSNKTLEYRSINLEKSDMTAFDYVKGKYGEEGIQRYKADVEDLVKNGRISKTKGKNLLMPSSEIPEDFLNRELTDSQYIAKKAREILEAYVRVVVPTTGRITARLREDWQLVDVMKEIDLPKYEKAGLTFTVVNPDGKSVQRIHDWTMRGDHRHHAMDALTIAFTKPSHIQYLNNLNARSDKSSSVYGIFQTETMKSGDKRIFIPPMPLDELRASFKRELESVLVSIKAKNKVVTRNTNVSKKKDGFNIKETLTPRGPLHKETIYGKKHIYETYEISVGGRLGREDLLNVANLEERNALLSRLEQYGGDSKKAFTGKNAPDKNPVFLDAYHTRQVSKKVRCVRLKDVYTVRKDIDASLNIDKVLDVGIRKLLKARLDEFGGNASKAFSTLDENPIWLNEAKGIAIKKVTIFENFDLVPIHEDRDYVNLRNNHHIAIYEDHDGNYVERVVSFFEALDRVTHGFKAVDKDWRKDEGYRFVFSMKINEMFVFPNTETGFLPEEVDLMDRKNYSIISPNLFRVQKLSSCYYCFRHHLETELVDTPALKDVTWKRVTSINGLKGVMKVRINHIGEIVSVGEYD